MTARGINPQRDSAIRRGLAFIFNTACNPENFHLYGSDYLCCFQGIAATARDAELRQLAQVLGQERARVWRRECARISHDLDATRIADLVFGCDAAEGLGVRDDAFKKRLQKIVCDFDSRDFLFFEPAVEPPSGDVPMDCECGVNNVRGSKSCQRCRQPLTMQSIYWVWFVALTRTYAGERLGVRLGASFAEVLKWLPAMHPYRDKSRKTDDLNFYWAIYAVTHVVYTLNDFNAYRLSPSWLPDEYAFLKRNLEQVNRMEDPEAMGEFLDSLKSFGLTESHPLVKKGVDYLLSCQNEDGSWGDPNAEDVYERYHPTWTAIDGLREYAWRGQKLNRERLRRLFQCNAKNGMGCKRLLPHPLKSTLRTRKEINA